MHLRAQQECMSTLQSDLWLLTIQGSEIFAVSNVTVIATVWQFHALTSQSKLRSGME